MPMVRHIFPFVLFPIHRHHSQNFGMIVDRSANSPSIFATPITLTVVKTLTRLQPNHAKYLTLLFLLGRSHVKIRRSKNARTVKVEAYRYASGEREAFQLQLTDRSIPLHREV